MTIPGDWIGYFGRHLRATSFRDLLGHQKVNHFPGSFQLGRKDRLWINLCQMRSRFGRAEFDFVPRTYCLPRELRRFHDAFERTSYTNQRQQQKNQHHTRPFASPSKRSSQSPGTADKCTNRRRKIKPKGVNKPQQNADRLEHMPDELEGGDRVEHFLEQTALKTHSPATFQSTRTSVCLAGGGETDAVADSGGGAMHLILTSDQLSPVGRPKSIEENCCTTFAITANKPTLGSVRSQTVPVTAGTKCP
ncbi:unnamed protein product [Protopolystoma xenopodis]|uniref:Uncharacterized protein n=1 Tax=Protopolystoma xenopodis TaxID=117903 RepID=A0A3S5CE37_9PLAT|nr:unnamed protein product [Protopolystoma xenopodis]